MWNAHQYLSNVASSIAQSHTLVKLCWEYLVSGLSPRRGWWPWLSQGEDWIILPGEQRLLSALSEWRPVTDGHLHCLSWLLATSISKIPYLHVSLPQQTAQRNNGSQEEQTTNETALLQPHNHCLSIFISLALFLLLHSALPVSNGWLALMTIKFSGYQLVSHKQNKKKHGSSKHYGKRMWSWFSYGDKGA